MLDTGEGAHCSERMILALQLVLIPTELTPQPIDLGESLNISLKTS